MQKLASPERGLQTASGDFLEAVLEGLSLPQKALPSRFFYDEAGSALFERITEVPEYYLTRAEIVLLNSFGAELREKVPPGAAVVEFGSGSSRKTGPLLAALDRPSAYIPIDISASALYPAARRVRQMFPSIRVRPILGSFGDLGLMQLPAGANPCIGFFPGSTIGNLAPAEAVSFLRSARRYLGPDAHFIIGADLQKPLDVLLPAYDDAQGVTAAFNRNILARINRELGGTFNPRWFEHAAVYNGTEGRIEMHLRASKAHRALVAGRSFAFRTGETIHTENSYKYTVAGFQALAIAGGWRPLKAWTGGANLFSLYLLA
jgi:dimethylhistidine N-methyltransferase